MITITEISKLKRLYKVLLDGADEDKIYVCEDTIVHFMMSKGNQLTPEELSALTEYDFFARGKSLALYYLSFKSRTCQQVRTYLLEHEIPTDKAEKVLSALTENGLLDDEAYAEAFIQGKISANTAGPYQIKRKLQEKGIDGDTIDLALESFYTEAKQIEVATKMAEKLARSKASQYSHKQLRQKIIQNLSAKGFSFAIAQIAFDALEIEPDEDNENELLQAELEKAYRKYSRSYEGYNLKNHILQALARKGFDFSSISDALRDYDL